MSSPGVSKQRVEILNKYGEKLVGVLHSTGSKNLVILCHGFRSTKDEKLLLNLIAALKKEGMSAFHFDFSGNGFYASMLEVIIVLLQSKLKKRESEGEFQYGNYRKEADDLRAVVLNLSEKNFKICAISGHSKGRFALERGIDGRLGKEFMQRIKKDGFIDVKDRTGKVEFRVTEESLMDRLTTDMRAACHAIDKECRVLTIHGSADEIVPSEDAFEFDKLIPNHKLHIIEGANHCYTAHQEQLASLVLDFIKSAQVVEATATRAI